MKEKLFLISEALFHSQPESILAGLDSHRVTLLTHEHMSRQELARHCPLSLPLRNTTFVYPVSKVWPMGYAWSGFVAQSCMFAVCRAAGLTERIFFSTDLPLPNCVAESFGLATDDICHLNYAKQNKCSEDW